MEFTLSRDKFSIIITSLVIAFSFGGVIAFYLGEFVIDNHAHFALLFSSILILILCIVFYLYRPLKYSIENGNIRISRMLGDKIILKDEIKQYAFPLSMILHGPFAPLVMEDFSDTRVAIIPSNLEP
jgi:cytochrome c biogenesis protein CcdA